MKDPANFSDPDKFDPTRFLDAEGRFKSHPANIYFGIGKRECLGKPLAKMEYFLFLANLVHNFSFEPTLEGLPDVNDCHIAVTRTPNKHKIKFVPRS